MNPTINDLTNEETLNHIKKLMKKEKNIKVYKKLLFLANRALGYTVKESSERAFISQYYGYTIQDEWMEAGYEGLLAKERKEGSGRKSKLNKRQLQQLSKILNTEKNLTIDKIINIIKEKWDIDYTYTGLKNLLKNQLNLNIDEYLNYTPRKDDNSIPPIKEIEKTIIDMEDEELKLLINYLHDEKELFVYKKLQSFTLQKLGIPIEVISKIMSVTRETLLTWNKQWENQEYSALLRKSGQGRKPKLNDEQWEEIRKILRNRNDWTIHEIADEIEKKYGVKYSFSRLSRILKKNLNFTMQNHIQKTTDNHHTTNNHFI